MATNNSINSQDPIQVSKGGTGLNTVAQGDLLIASALNTLASLPKNTTATRYLSNTGVNNAPAYAQVDLSNGVTGTLPIANGGTGVTTGAFTSTVTQVFTASGTYTPTSGMKFCIIEVCGAGGGGGGSSTTTGSTSSSAGGGGGGGYARKTVSSATIGASQTVTIGSGGSAGVANGANGGTGGTTSVGSIVSATGGVGALTSGAVTPPSQGGEGGSGGAGSSGDFNITGSDGFVGNNFGTNQYNQNGGMGGSSYFAGNKKALAANPGATGYSYGGGGSGGSNHASTAGQNGGAGAPGIVIITEFIA